MLPGLTQADNDSESPVFRIARQTQRPMSRSAALGAQPSIIVYFIREEPSEVSDR